MQTQHQARELRSQFSQEVQKASVKHQSKLAVRVFKSQSKKGDLSILER